MTDSTVVVLGLTPTGELHECEACSARWDVPLGSDEDDIDIRDHRLGLIAEHVCDPFVDPARVLAIRQRADQLAAEVGPCPVDMNARADGPFDWDASKVYHDRVRHRGETLTWELEYDLASLSVAKCCGGWTSVPDDIISAAHRQAERAHGDPRRRALQLARCAVFQCPPLRPDPRCFRPSDVRLAMTLLGEVRREEAPAEWSQLAQSDADALAWLEDFERDACGTF